MKLLIWFLKQNKLSPKNRALILNYLLESVQALPIKDLITYELDGTIKLGGKELTVEQATLLRNGATSLENNWAYKSIKEQLAFEAIKLSIHSSLNFDAVLMSKAIMWIQQNEIKFIKELSGQNDQERNV